ncbi:MAG: endonuclease [Saprospiraceae bacterium]
MKKFGFVVHYNIKLFFLNKVVLGVYLIVISAAISAKAQFIYAPVLPEMNGESLRLKLAETYRPTVVLDYNIARDTLFSKIHAIHDTLYCVYTNLGIYIPPGTDPTQAVYLNGIPNGINTEHVYPESKGASGVAKGDMHNLFPSKSKVNSDRADKQYRDIPDQETKRWYFEEKEITTMPNAQIRDMYSESNNDYFEPRESVKGDVARAIFYFYTMYTEKALIEDIHFFEDQMSTLCEWHYLDPVDQAEWNRNIAIATYQGGGLNPFILDCSLVSRAYCNNIDQTCEATVPVQDFTFQNSNISIEFRDGNLTVRSDQEMNGDIMIYDALGRDIFSSPLAQSQEFTAQLHLYQGLLFAVVKDQRGQIIKSKKLLIP